MSFMGGKLTRAVLVQMRWELHRSTTRPSTWTTREYITTSLSRTWASGGRLHYSVADCYTALEHGDPIRPNESLNMGHGTASNVAYMVLDPTHYNFLMENKKVKRVQLFDPTAEDAMCQAAYLASTGERRSYMKDERPCSFLVQFHVDPYNLGGHLYSQRIFRRGYTVVGLQVASAWVRAAEHDGVTSMIPWRITRRIPGRQDTSGSRDE